MDSLILIDAEKLKSLIDTLNESYSKLSTIFSKKVIDFIDNEVSLLISCLKNSKISLFEKKNRLQRVFYKINGVRNTIQFIEIDKNLGLEESTKKFCENLLLMEEKIVRIILLL